MKKQITLIIIGILIVQGTLTAFAGSLLTKSSDFTKVATYGMNFATYTAEKKNGKEAAEKLLGYDILWDVMGKGEEFLLNGDPDAFPKFKDDVLKVKLVLDKVAEIASKLGSGEYDDAAIAGMDTAVGLINHPVVNALWEAVKLTYESHKLVQSSKAALDIEALYGTVNADRRLIGTNTGDAPDLIPVNSDTITYFFNKYLIVNASTRAQVKAYVKNKLGEDFPEMSTSSKIWAAVTFTSDAEKAEHELQELKEFENNSRRWIKELLEDLNKQVQLQWAETRAFQRREEFKVFFASIGNTFQNLDAALAYFAKKNRLKKQKDKFPEYLKKYETQATTLTNKYKTLKPVQIGQKLAIRRQLLDISDKCHAYSIDCITIDDFTLADSFEKQQTHCLIFINEIDKEIKSSEDEMLEGLTTAATTSNNYTRQSNDVAYENFMLSLFSNVIPEYLSVTDEIKPLSLNKIKDALTDNNLKKAQSIITEWTNEKNKFYNRRNVVVKKTYKDGNLWTSFPTSDPSIVDEVVLKAFKMAAENKPPWRSVETYNLRSPIKHNASEDMKKYHEGECISTRDRYFDGAETKSRTALDAVQHLTDKKFADDMTKAQAMLNLYSQKRAEVGATVSGNINQLRRIAESARKVYIHAWIKSYHEYLKENTYTSIGRIYESSQVNFNSVGNFIRGKKHEIQTPIGKFENQIKALDVVDAQAYAMREVKKIWSDFSRLENQTIELYNDFGYKKLDYKTELRYVENLLNGFGSGNIKSAANTFIQLAQTDIENRQKDIDYLDTMEKQYSAWHEKYKQEGIIHLDHTTGYYVFGFRKDHDTGYAIVNEPYSHFATKKGFSTNQKQMKSKTDLQNLSVYSLINSSMPKSKQFLDNQFNGANFTMAKEDNFLIGKTPVWKSDLENSEKVVSGMKAEDPDFTNKLKKIAKLFPSILSFPEKTEEDKKKSKYELEWNNTLGVWKKLYTDTYKEFKLGQRFIKLREKILEIRLIKSHLLQKERSDKFQAEESKKRLAEYQKKFNSIKSEANQLLDSGKFSKTTIDSLYRQYWDLRTKYFNDKTAEDPGFSSSLKSYDTDFANLFKKLEGIEEGIIQKIKELYSEFKSAYEQMDEYQLVDFLSQNWDSGDGTTLTDLEDNFRNMFSVYDSIEYSISNLAISKKSQTVFIASYEVTITGQSFDLDITRNEKSSVSEEIIFENDQPKINRTLNGRFWYRQ